MKIAIIDYGSGNLHSTHKAFERVARELNPAASAELVTEASAIASATHVVLPGVGAYGDCKNSLASVPGMIDALSEHAFTAKKPLFGICVGMQLLGTRGLEHGTHEGLGWIPGEVVPIAPADSSLKIPHMGWNELSPTNDHPILEGIEKSDHVYFVHSYHMACGQQSDVIATTEYGTAITAIIARENIVGTQFHPEKSQQVGLQIIRNFLKM